MAKENNLIKTEDEDYWTNREFHDKRRDWDKNSGNWIEDYWGSKSHPHREKIILAVGSLEPFESILEIGCNCGPNIALLRERFTYLKDENLTGIDVNKDAIAKARERMPAVNWRVASVTKLPFEDKSFDCIISDAVLMYLGPDQIKKAIAEINRVTRKAVVLVEWYDWWSSAGRIKDFHWARNYPRIFKKLGFKVEKIKLTKAIWPNAKWIKYGYIFIAKR